MKKRIIAGLLVLVLLFTAVPVSALAAPPEEQAAVNTGDASIEGTNGFGTLLSQEIAESEAATEEEAASYEAGYTVTDLIIEGATATVTYDSLEEALLVVALYTEDGMRMVTSATATVTADATEATVEFTGDMPEYFLASAYLMDTYDLSPLCAAYDTPMYTQEMQELLASTVEDYDADRVMNLDDDNTTNFAVYTETTIVIEPVEGVNIVTSIDDETATYVIENADESITSLVEGDIFAYPCMDGEIIIVKVVAITVDGTTATITGGELEMNEVFDYVKIEAVGESDDFVIDEDSGDEGVTYVGTEEVAEDDQSAPVPSVGLNSVESDTGSKAVAHVFNLEKTFQEDADGYNTPNYVKLSGSLGITLKAGFDFYLSLDRQYAELKVDVDIKLAVSVTGKLAAAVLELPGFGVVPCPGVYIGFDPKFEPSFTAKAELSCTLSWTTGFKFENWRVQNLTTAPKIDTQITIEGKMFIGFNLDPHIVVASKYAVKFTLSAPVGVTITGKLTGLDYDGSGLDYDLSTLEQNKPETLHVCHKCLAITIKASVGLTVKAQLFKYLTSNTEIALLSFDLGKMYYSFDYAEPGMDTCPHIYYRVSVVVLDQEGNPVPSAAVTVGTAEESTNGKGVAYFYVPEGEYRFTATANGLTDSCDYQITTAMKVGLVLTEEEDEDDPPGFGILGTVEAEEATDNSVIKETTLNNNRYQLFDTSMTWTNAQAYCESIGGHLVTITSQEEQSLIESLLASGSRLEYWIGAYYLNGSYVWVTGEEFTFNNWASGQPDHYGGTENYGQIFAQYVGGSHRFPAYTWNDIMDSNNPGNGDPYFNQSTIGFICEFESNTTSESGTGINVSEGVDLMTGRENGGSVSTNAVYPGDYGTEVTDAYRLKTASFTGLVPGEQYVLLAMVSIEVDAPLASDNLLFIDQAEALEDGTLSFRYVQRETTDISYVVACGASNKDLNDAVITFPEMIADGELQVVEPTVVYDGRTLTEGQDYVIVGTVDFAEAGTYTCCIRGVHNYTGLVECSYTVTAPVTEVASGWSGYTAWTLTDDGTLTFTGEGAMKNYTTKDGMPWYSYFDQITSVVLGEGVISIGDYAFYGMPALESITIPETVTAIGNYAFKGSEKLTGVVLPAGLTKLGESAFYGCTSLTAIDIPASLWTVQPYTFKNCTALESVTFHEGNLQKISDGAFYNTALTEVSLPDCLSILDVYVFKNCAKLASVTLGSGLTQIREAVLYGTAISEIIVPEGVTSIKPYAFKNCVNLTTVTLPSTLTVVEEAAFYACTALESVELPDDVTKIGNYAFRKCTGLISVEFGSRLTNIGESSFYGCTGLTALEIPENVTTIQAYAFKGCTAVTAVSLPDSLMTIGDSAFHTCTGLQTIVIPTNVEMIGEYCFSGSWNLWQIIFEGDAPSVGVGAFKSLVATAYYPADNATWTSDVMQNYGGTITWKAQ